MSTYVMSDIHGCYNEFLSMLDKIRFSDTDYLILAGDCIDRGKQSFEMLRWMENCPKNVLLIRGNHEEEFASYIMLMLQLGQKKKIEIDLSSNHDAGYLYKLAKYFLKRNSLPSVYFDPYNTIKSLLHRNDVTLLDLCRWAERISQMPYYCKKQLGDRTCIVVHAGYSESVENISASFSSLEEFYIYAREESISLGGKEHGIILAGHTPTILKGEFSYNHGKAFRYYDKERDCVFYDIDCGCVFRRQDRNAGLACIRLEDEEVYYV